MDEHSPILAENDGHVIEAYAVGSSKMLLNRDAELASYGPTLSEKFADGVPADWQSLPDVSHVSVGEVAGHRFAAKTRRYVQNPDNFPLWRRMEEAGRVLEIPTRALEAFGSLENELELSSVIKGALDADWLQKELGERGYGGIKYVEPILGVETLAPSRTSVVRKLCCTTM